MEFCHCWGHFSRATSCHKTHWSSFLYRKHWAVSTLQIIQSFVFLTPVALSPCCVSHGYWKWREVLAAFYEAPETHVGMHLPYETNSIFYVAVVLKIMTEITKCGNHLCWFLPGWIPRSTHPSVVTQNTVCTLLQHKTLREDLAVLEKGHVFRHWASLQQNYLDMKITKNNNHDKRIWFMYRF